MMSLLALFCKPSQTHPQFFISLLRVCIFESHEPIFLLLFLPQKNRQRMRFNVLQRQLHQRCFSGIHQVTHFIQR